MIADIFKNYKLYCDINEGFKLGFEFIRFFHDTELPDGKYELDGSRVYAMVQSYDTLPEEEMRFEAHREYIDLQYVVRGSEIIKWTNIMNLIPCTKHDNEKDYTLYEGTEGTDVKLKDSCFVILLPEDAHKPKCIWGRRETIKKIVVKIKVNSEK